MATIIRLTISDDRVTTPESMLVNMDYIHRIVRDTAKNRTVLLKDGPSLYATEDLAEIENRLAKVMTRLTV